MADAEAKKILSGLWASGAAADREDPVDAGLTRSTGWPLSYEQIGTRDEPEREVFNQKNREWDGWAVENMRTGGTKPWDSEVNYFQYGRVAVEGSKYWASVATGPSTGNSTNPMTSGQTVWRLY